MSGPSRFAVLRELWRDTFRQALASGVCWMMLAVTALCVLLCLSVSVSGDTKLVTEGELSLFLPRASPYAVVPSVVTGLAATNPLEAASLTAGSQKVWFAYQTNPDVARGEGIETVAGRMSLAFGAISFPLGRERADAVRFLELLLAAGIAGTVGLLLTLIWTAGFAPTFLEPSAASVLLAKPVARWQLLVGKYIGVVLFVGLQVTLFVVLTWLALGVRTGVWDMTYWWCIPLLLLQFAVFYGFSVLLAVVTRSTVACVFGAVLFWCLGWGINYGSAMTQGLGESIPPGTAALAEAAYWISPKPIDTGVILWNALDAKHHFQQPLAFELLQAAGFSPVLSILSSLAIAAALLALASYELEAADY
jgi:hypothetical protein